MSKVVKYDITGMSMDITEVEHDPTLRVWSDDTIYHNINIILNRWYEPESKDITIGVFRSLENYGPKSHNEEDVDIWLHPFKWENQWHLVVGINPHNKIILINCSMKSKTGFPVETCIEFEQFISHFKSKVTKEALQYPKFCNELLDPTNEDNGINLLTIVLTFCLRPDTLIKLFCDPSTTPRQFDVSDLVPYVINADSSFRKTLPQPVESKKSTKLKESRETQKVDNKNNEENIDTNNITGISKEKISEKVDNGPNNDEISDLESESDLDTVSKQPQQKKEIKNEVKKEIKKEPKVQNKREIKKETRKDFRKNNSRSSDQMSSNPQVPPAKRLRSLNGSFEQPIDLDELEDDESAVEELEYQKEQSFLGKSSANNKQIKTEMKTISVDTKVAKQPVKQPVIEKEEKEKDIQSLFRKRLPHSFSKLLQMSSFGEGKNEIDIILETIENWTHSKQTNLKLKKDENDLKNWLLLIREHLFVAFTRKTKREFNEEELNELLEVDHPNEIFPLLFENNTIFLVNFHTKDMFKTNINIIVISTRARGEKEIMKNYAFKRLVEMYVWKYNRLITRIRTSVITVTDGTAYEVFMVALYCIHRFIMLSKFDIKFSPNMEQVESYMDNFERLMQSIKNNDELKRNLSYKRLLKHIS